MVASLSRDAQNNRQRSDDLAAAACWRVEQDGDDQTDDQPADDSFLDFVSCCVLSALDVSALGEGPERLREIFRLTPDSAGCIAQYE